ncbi:MAG TPA: 6-phosphogluconolactonase [Acidiferrobacterales bacterium]|nr:6-phosphogluconolactonase [Acidiferrobacterales bacterium]
MTGHIHIALDLATLSSLAAEQVVTAAQEAIVAHALFFIALAGGKTPEQLYQMLAQPAFADRVDWSRTHVFFSDERCVPPDHDDSNYRLAATTLLSHVSIPAMQIHRMQGELSDARQAARDYAQLLLERLPRTPQGVPVFDLILLGLGQDGHVASLFPGTPILQEHTQPVAAVYVEKLHSWRISLTLPVIAATQRILLLIAGDAKAGVVHDLLYAADASAGFPLRLIQPEGRIDWYLDAAAANKLDPRKLERLGYLVHSYS